MVKLVMVSDAAKLFHNIPTLIEGLERIEKHSHDDYSIDEVVNDILNGNLWLMVVMSERGYEGFVTVKPFYGVHISPRLQINQMYLKPDAPRECFDAVDEKLTTFCRQRGFKYLLFSTTREKGFDKKLKDRGWVQTYVEFAKEVGDG